MKIPIAVVLVASCCSLLVQSHPLNRVESDSDVSLKEIKDDVERILEIMEIEIPSDSDILKRVRKESKAKAKIFHLCKSLFPRRKNS